MKNGTNEKFWYKKLLLIVSQQIGRKMVKYYDH